MTMNDDDDPFREIEVESDPIADLHCELDVLRESRPELVPDDMNAANLVDVDAEVMTNGAASTDADIVAMLLNNGEESDDESDVVKVDDELLAPPLVYEIDDELLAPPSVYGVDDELLAPPSVYEIERATETLSQFSLFCDGDEVKRQVDSLAKEINTSLMGRKKQKTIDYYFT